MLQEEKDHRRRGLALLENIWNLSYRGPRECWGTAEPPAQGDRTLSLFLQMTMIFFLFAMSQI